MIEPNTIYIINKSNFATQASVLVKICMTLKFAKREPIDPNIFIEYVTQALSLGKCIILVSFNEKQELNVCVVMFVKNNPVKGLILWVEWAWTDGKNLSLSKNVWDRIEEIAQQLKANKIACAMVRGFRAVGKRYGLIEEYRVMSKSVKEVVKND